MEPLTKDHFEAWRKEEFVPHIVKEEVYEKKVDRLWWTAVTALFVGGATLSIFMWVLLQKNDQIDRIQGEVHRIALNQAGVVETLKGQQVEIARQATVQSTLTQALVDALRVQNALHSNNRDRQ